MSIAKMEMKPPPANESKISAMRHRKIYNTAQAYRNFRSHAEISKILAKVIEPMSWL